MFRPHRERTPMRDGSDAQRHAARHDAQRRALEAAHSARMASNVEALGEARRRFHDVTLAGREPLLRSWRRLGADGTAHTVHRRRFWR